MRETVRTSFPRASVGFPSLASFSRRLFGFGDLFVDAVAFFLDVFVGERLAIASYDAVDTDAIDGDAFGVGGFGLLELAVVV